jgi:[acyl-carrier-protein] S-malonyltransferase
MGADLWRESPAARRVFDVADETLGYELSRLCFEGPEERLRETEHTQPAILATSLACLAAAVESGRITGRPTFMAGHSLGEYSALVAAGALSLEDGFRLIRERARLMQHASTLSKGAMAAIIGMDEPDVVAMCEEAGVDVCNLNLPSQTVIGGEASAVSRAVAMAKERGAQRAIELNVGGAFHSRLMRPAIDGLVKAVSSTKVAAPQVPVIANATATEMTDAQAVRDELGAQVARPVRWHQSVTLMAANGVVTFIEFGPGKVLTGMARRIVPGATLLNVSNFADAGAAPTSK